jgi:hypothetical protein
MNILWNLGFVFFAIVGIAIMAAFVAVVKLSLAKYQK